MCLAGDYFTHVGIEATIVSGEKTVKRLIKGFKLYN